MLVLRDIMKIRRIIIIASAIILFAGCATEPKSPVDAFRGQSAEKLFKDAETDLHKKDYDEAIKRFEALDVLYPFGEYAEKSQLDVITAYYKSDDLDSTIAASKRYIHLHPTSPTVDYAYYMKAVATFEKNQSWLNVIYTRDPAARDLSMMRESFVYFNDLVTQFPNSKYTPDARKRMIYIRNLIARHELFIADYYLDHEAYVAAANRASYIVEHLQGSPQVEDALKIMVKAYQALGATKEANDAQRILNLNYPQQKK